MSLVGPRDPRRPLAQTQQRPGGWAVVPVPLSSQDQSGPSEPGRPSSFLWLGELSLGDLWPNPGREGSPRHCVWATRILGEVKGRQGAGRDTAWGNLPGFTRYGGGGVPALLQPRVGAASCSITSQGLPSAAGRPRPFLSQLREGQGIARGVYLRAGQVLRALVPYSPWGHRRLPPPVQRPSGERQGLTGGRPSEAS